MVCGNRRAHRRCAERRRAIPVAVGMVPVAVAITVATTITIAVITIATAITVAAAICITAAISAVVGANAATVSAAIIDPFELA